jgi:hypothetical protein
VFFQSNRIRIFQREKEREIKRHEEEAPELAATARERGEMKEQRHRSPALRRNAYLLRKECESD